MKKIKKSEIVWTSLLAIVMIISGIFCMPLLGVIWLGGSFGVIGHGLRLVSDTNHDYISSLWCYLFPVTWIIFIIGGIIWLCIIFYENCIEPINKKIDGE